MDNGDEVCNTCIEKTDKNLPGDATIPRLPEEQEADDNVMAVAMAESREQHALDETEESVGPCIEWCEVCGVRQCKFNRGHSRRGGPQSRCLCEGCSQAPQRGGPR